MATLPFAVEAVELTLTGSRSPVLVRGRDADGTTVAETVVQTEATLAGLSGEGIVTVLIEPSQPTKGAALTQLCYSRMPHPASYSHVLASEATIGPSGGSRGYPIVEGRRTESSPWEAWLPDLIGTEQSQDGECAYLAYDPPAPGPWWGFRIAPFARWPLLVVSACGVPWTVPAAAQQGDADNRATLIDAITSKTDLITGATTPAQHPILDSRL